jgi:hypothetical protein
MEGGSADQLMQHALSKCELIEMGGGGMPYTHRGVLGVTWNPFIHMNLFKPHPFKVKVEPPFVTSLPEAAYGPSYIGIISYKGFA